MPAAAHAKLDAQANEVERMLGGILRSVEPAQQDVPAPRPGSCGAVAEAALQRYLVGWP